MSQPTGGYRGRSTAGSAFRRSTLLRWLRRQRSGPIFRLMRAYIIFRSGPVSVGAVAAAIRDLLRRSDVASTSSVIDGFSLRGEESSARIATAGNQLAASGRLRIAWIGSPRAGGRPDDAEDWVDLYPENWRYALQHLQPHLIVANAEGISESGPWAGRLSYSLSPDRLSERDLRTLHEEVCLRNIPLVLVMPRRGAPDWRAWRESARFFDVVIARESPDAPNLDDDQRIVGRVELPASGGGRAVQMSLSLAEYIEFLLV